MRVGSLFAGIGGFDLGFERAGMTTAWQVEIDPKCRELLAARFPHARQFDDVTTCGAHNLEPVDVVCGGFPCQDLSVAGKRAGLAGARSGLFYEMVRITDELRAPWLVWENVPGLLSSHRGRDFAAVLVELERVGYRGCWTTLDARYFGVAQRRRRIFGVFARGYSGAERAAEVLALAARLRGNPAPGRAEGKDVAGPLGTGASAGGGHRQDLDSAGAYVTRQTCGTLSPGAHPGSYNGQDAYTDHLIAHSLEASDGHHGRSSPRGDGCDNLVAGPLYYSHDYNQDRVYGTGGVSEGATATRRPNFLTPVGVRRLTPTECARLQGFPDNWLDLGGEHGDAEEANADEVLCRVWSSTPAIAREGWRPGELAALLTPEVLLAGVHVGWIPWEMAYECAARRGALPGADPWPEGFVRGLRLAAQHRPSPYRRESFEQLARELGRSLSSLPLEAAQTRAYLLGSGLLKEAPEAGLLRHARAASEAARANKPLSDTHRYRMLGNAVAVPCAAWIGRRLVTQ